VNKITVLGFSDSRRVVRDRNPTAQDERNAFSRRVRGNIRMPVHIPDASAGIRLGIETVLGRRRGQRRVQVQDQRQIFTRTLVVDRRTKR